MSYKTLLDSLNKFDFSDGEKYVFVSTYDLRNIDDADLLDNDSADAASCVGKFGLSHDINARHYSTVIDGDHITDMVDIKWEFWKNE